MLLKRFTAGAAALLLLGTLSVSPLIVEAASYSNSFSENVFTYTVNKIGKYSRNNASTGWTGTTTSAVGSSAGYDRSYKYARYTEYKDVKGKYVELYTSKNSGTAEIIKTNVNHTMSNEVVRRAHVTELHLGSNADSSVAEKIVIHVDKPNE